jgi:hypothetical protein
MYQPTHIDSAAAGIADTPLTIDRPIRATLTYSNRSSKRVRLGFSKMNDKGQWYELWYTWRSYTGLKERQKRHREDACIQSSPRWCQGQPGPIPTRREHPASPVEG